MSVEDEVYRLIQDANPEDKFVLANPHEIGILRNNDITIKGVIYHVFNESDYVNYEKLSKQYNCVDTETEGKSIIYVLVNYLSEYDIKHIPAGIKVLAGFNALKYLAAYPAEIERDGNSDEDDDGDTTHNFVSLLKTEYKTSLFYCHYNTGIVGIEGYLPFYKPFHPYLDTVENIYIINMKRNQQRLWRDHYEFSNLMSDSSYNYKVRYLEVDVAQLYKAHPELIAYYRVPNDRLSCWLGTYHGFSGQYTELDDSLVLGYDFYAYSDNIKELTTLGVTHIMNVANECVQRYNYNEIKYDTIQYEHYPIVEGDIEKSKPYLYAAVDRLHELLDNPTDAGSTHKHRVFVHCFLGVNRSPTVIMLYLIRHRGMTLYDAYKWIAMKRRIFTNLDLFKVLYEESIEKHGSAGISPLKLKTHHANNFSEPTAYMFAFYDYLYLERLFAMEEPKALSYIPK